jgi:hypothetical protein
MTCLEQIVVTVAKQATKQEMIRHLKPPCRPTAFPIRVGVPPNQTKPSDFFSLTKKQQIREFSTPTS